MQSGLDPNNPAQQQQTDKHPRLLLFLFLRSLSFYSAASDRPAKHPGTSRTLHVQEAPVNFGSPLRQAVLEDVKERVTLVPPVVPLFLSTVRSDSKARLRTLKGHSSVQLKAPSKRRKTGSLLHLANQERS